MPDRRLARKFLHRVWGEQLARLPLSLQNDDYLYGFLAQKGPDASWTDTPLAQLPSSSVKLRLPDNTNDLYYSINLFTKSYRRRVHVPGGCWLYADLDEVHPVNDIEDGLKPTLAIESSPGRYQGLWLLDRWLNTRRLSALNQQLTYHVGADKGNWKMTQVLRVPGTISTKHGTPHEVKLLWARPSSLLYTPATVRALVGDAATPQSLSDARELKLPSVSAQRLLKRYASRLPTEAKRLARTKTVLGSEDRSSRLWRLECLLLEAGMKPEEAFVVIAPTPWNKWADTPDQGHAQLWTEINKALKHVEKNAKTNPPDSKSSRMRSGKSGSATDASSRSSTTSKSSRSDGSSEKSRSKSQPDSATTTPQSATPRVRKRKKITTDSRRTLVPLNDFLLTRLPKPSWLVEGVWSHTAHGLLAGEAKTYKSLLTMDLAVSVASGTPFLNRFPIPKPGPVIIIQEENDAADMHDRLMRITASRGFAPKAHTSNGHIHFDQGESLPVHLLNRQGFTLNDEDDLEYLARWASALQPALIILDPLYLMTPGLNTNEATDMTPVLNNLLRIKQAHGCGIQLVHHFRKTHKDERSQRAASRIAGTSVFHRWLASAIYIDPTEMDGTVHVSSEHRSFRANDSFYLSFDLGTDDDVHYDPQIKEAVDLSDNGTGDGHDHNGPDPLIDDGMPHNAAWLAANHDRVFMWLDDNMGSSFFVARAARALKMTRSKDLYQLLNKYHYTFKTIKDKQGTTRLKVYAPNIEDIK